MNVLLIMEIVVTIVTILLVLITATAILDINCILISADAKVRTYELHTYLKLIMYVVICT